MSINLSSEHPEQLLSLATPLQTLTRVQIIRALKAFASGSSRDVLAERAGISVEVVAALVTQDEHLLMESLLPQQDQNSSNPDASQPELAIDRRRGPGRRVRTVNADRTPQPRSNEGPVSKPGLAEASQATVPTVLDPVLPKIDELVLVLVHPIEGGGYWAEAPDYPGAVAQVKTLDALKSEIIEAIEDWCTPTREKTRAEAEKLAAVQGPGTPVIEGPFPISYDSPPPSKRTEPRENSLAADPLWGMFREESELIDQIVEGAMKDRRVAPDRASPYE